MISEKVYKLCTSKESVSALLAKNPSLSPEEAWKQLFGGDEGGEKESVTTAKANRDNHTPEDLQRARECGKWGPTEPSDLFLRLYHDALCTLDKSISGCMVSPSLMGSCGMIPLTVISVVPDIMRHMSNLIVRAEKEVILATNYWQNSVASKYITNAMRELSRRAGERGERIVFKLEYDRGSAKQALNNHMSVPPKDYMGTAVNIPAPEDIPFIDLDVVNYHRPMVGTFHCKYMIVDRKYAVLQSNNIQDNDNMEMMTHLEGPIVDSLYDMALISWNNKLDPPLPCANSPAAIGGVSSFNTENHNAMFTQSGPNGHSAIVHPDQKRGKQAYEYQPRDISQPGALPSSASMEIGTAKRTDALTGSEKTENAVRPAGESETAENEVAGITNGMEQAKLRGDSRSIEHDGPKLGPIEKLQENAKAVAVTGDVDHIPDPVKEHNSKSGKHEDETQSNLPGFLGPDAETKEFLSEGDQQLPQSQIEHPSPVDNLLPEHTTDDPHYDVDIAGEVARVQTAVSPKNGETRIEAVTRHLNHTKNVGFKGNAPECEPEEEMTPYIPHPVHEPFPIAMVCREPYGTPNHNSVYNPQNEVWLSALRNAKKNVFIQSPTLNAEPLVPAIIEACERGIDVYCYICLGYNDTGELLPKQGGTNEMIAHKMYTSLSAAGKQKLHYFFYIGKDQTVPIVAKKKKRDCHIKVMIVDEHIGIQGNGNQDTQSWYHSQEINVMFDSALVCKAWIDGLRRNQNTHLYGEVGKADGVWRDQNGNEASDVIGVDPGRFAWAKGFMGAIRRVRGAGDF
ncbi:related to IQ calmodulin-binding motif protein [Rhynchosporium graminicola]|uniref:Related to IQ calmodulin-binding motif protein n=1 Tax=Rhynchosporium graminicola TaxID=2792576 RepID=A0A1E1JSR0_9HELO|nr:related to IQ calmodulin-binding motif protein [Rhynchosporium commune]